VSQACPSGWTGEPMEPNRHSPVGLLPRRSRELHPARRPGDNGSLSLGEPGTPCGTFLIPRAQDQGAPGIFPMCRPGPLSQAGAMDTCTTDAEAAEAGQPRACCLRVAGDG
jgi:hypothetical protein